MTSNIRLNYEKVMREAARLDGEENVFEEQIKKICGVAERLRHEWESPASAVCIQKIEQIAEEMTETVNEDALEEISEEMETEAAETEDVLLTEE